MKRLHNPCSHGTTKPPSSELCVLKSLCVGPDFGLEGVDTSKVCRNGLAYTLDARKNGPQLRSAHRSMHVTAALYCITTMHATTQGAFPVEAASRRWLSRCPLAASDTRELVRIRSSEEGEQ